MSVSDAPQALIEDHFGRRLGGEVTLVERKIASQGLSDETAILAFYRDGDTVRVVVRVYRAGAIARHEVDPQRLYQLLVALSDTQIPAPRPLWFETSPELFGSPYSVVSWVPGEAVVPWSGAGRRMLAEAGTGRIGEQFPALLADIHALDWQVLGATGLPVPGAGTDFAGGCVAQIADYLSQVRTEPEPILTDALGWMRANLPAAQRICLVHGDYRTGNMLFERDRISGLLDWEFARIGDPDFDLGWVCAPSNRVRSDLVCMLLPEEQFLQRYGAHSGHQVDPTALQFWKVFHQVRHAIMWLDAGYRFANGETDDIRLARMHYTMPAMRIMVAELMEKV